MKNEKASRCFVPRRIRDQLRAAESHAVGVRKALKKLQPTVAKGGGDMDDALQLAGTIERLAHYGQTCSAEEAVSIVSQVEVFASMLRAEVDGFIVS